MIIKTQCFISVILLNECGCFQDPNSSSQKGLENVVDSHSFSQAPTLNNTQEEQGLQQSQSEVIGQGKSENQITEE